MYQKAGQAFDRLQKNTARQAYREDWLKVIDLYRQVFESQPSSPQADQAMFMAGRLYQGMFRKSWLPSDLDMAAYYYRRLVKAYPASRLADDGLFAIGEILLGPGKDPAAAAAEFEKIAERYPSEDMAPAARDKLARLGPYRSSPGGAAAIVPISAGRPAKVTAMRHWTDPTYTRVVVDVDQPVRFNPKILKEPEAEGRPRLYIDIFNALLGPEINRPIPVVDGLLLRARAGQFTADTVRVVLDLARVGVFRVFTLSDPFRIVIDLTGNGKGKGPAPAGKTPAAPGGGPSLAQQLGLSIRKVVLDPGHGGSDPGALGVDGLLEKDVTLDLAVILRKILVERYGLEVVMTREADVYLPLEERTALANTSRADLFLSIHCNSSPANNLQGVETFFLNFASSKEAAETAARENMTSVARVADFEKTVVDLFMSMKVDESSRLARLSHDETIRRLRSRHPEVRNLGVRQAPFVVLIGAQMPAILSEVSFINHPVEGKRLAEADYRLLVGEGLASGIEKYVRSFNLVSTR